MKSGCRMEMAPDEVESKAVEEAMRYLFICRYVLRGLGTRGSLGNRRRSGRTAAGEMSLSAAVSACCKVWKSSVMAYLMVIVRGGERPPCLHAGICGVQSGGLGGSGGGAAGRWCDFTLGFIFPFHKISCTYESEFIYTAPQDRRRQGYLKSADNT